jgi:hypothetical protein
MQNILTQILKVNDIDTLRPSRIVAEMKEERRFEMYSNSPCLPKRAG